MNNITYAVSVDVNNPIIPYNVYVANVLDSNVRYLEITLYQNGNVIALSNEATATASLVTDDVLIDDSVECTISNNIITVPLEDLQRHGNLDVQVTVTEGTKVLAIPFPIQVRVTPNIAEEAQIDEDSLGSYAEVVQEIAEARKGHNSLDERLNSDASGKEAVINKVQSIGSQSQTFDNDKYPSVTAVRDYVNVRTNDLKGYIDNELDGLDKAKADKTDTNAQFERLIAVLQSKAGKAETLAGYGINDAYTKAEVDALENNKEDKINKVQSIGSQSQTFDNDKYPSVTAVRDYVNVRNDDLKGYIDNELDGLDEAKTDKSDVFDAVVRNYQDVTPDITFDIHNTAIATYLTESAVYSPNDYDVTKVPTSLSGTPYDTPNATTIDLPTGSSKVILYDTVAKTEQVISVSGSTYTITNLIPNRVYAYTVRNSSDTMLSYGTVKATGHIRMIDGGGNTFNIRDLGGWTCDGGKTKYGLIYRGAELNGAVSLNSSQVDFFKNVLGIRDEIDLRNPTSTGVGSGALGLGVDYVNIYTNYSPYALQDLYRQERVDIIKRIAKNIKEKKVTYIHCSAGADRTAIICTFIEAICGVSQNDIDRDYELSAFAYDTNNDRLSTRTRKNTWLNGHRTMINGDGTESYSYPYINNMEGSSFQDKIVRFLLRSGVTIDELNDIRFGLIDGNPTALTNPYGNATITKNLSHVFIDNEATSVKLYQPFEANLTVEDWYKLDYSSTTSYEITMGGTDITSNCVNGKIRIERVTGNITIKAIAVDNEARIDSRIDDLNTSKLDDANNSVKTNHITNLNVTEGKLADGAVTSAKIGSGEVKTTNVDDSAITTAKIANGAATADKIGASAVTTEKINDGAVTTAKLASGAVTLSKLDSGVIDSTLSVQGAAAEAAVTGAAINGMKSDVEDIKAYLGYDDEHIVGLQADFKNKVFKRLAGAAGLSAGSDFDAFPMYGGRRRCNVAADGTINAYYGDEGYTEDGTNGQVMVYQPVFWYKVVPLDMDRNTSGVGYHIRKANYYVSSKPKVGFKRHPLFYDEQGNPVDYVLLSAYEGSMYDASEEAYVNDSVDTSVSYGAGDLLCSVAEKKPISGKLNGIGTKVNFETMANNIGSGWHLNTIKAESANQLLMLIELGRFNTQAAIGQGVVSCPNNGSYNCSSYTGSTASLGNATGMATETTYESAGTETVNTTNGKLSVTYRGVENPWGNIWKHTNGINLWGDGTMNGGQVFICDDFSFNESKHDGNYQSAGFTIPNGGGYVSAFGYGDEDYDWLFMPSETTGNSSLPVGDSYWCTPNLNGYRIARLGGSWNNGDNAGGFFWYCNGTPGARDYYAGGRLLYVPTATV